MKGSLAQIKEREATFFGELYLSVEKVKIKTKWRKLLKKKSMGCEAAFSYTLKFLVLSTLAFAFPSYGGKVRTRAKARRKHKSNKV